MRRSTASGSAAALLVLFTFSAIGASADPLHCRVRVDEGVCLTPETSPSSGSGDVTDWIQDTYEAAGCGNWRTLGSVGRAVLGFWFSLGSCGGAQGAPPDPTGVAQDLVADPPGAGAPEAIEQGARWALEDARSAAEPALPSTSDPWGGLESATTLPNPLPRAAAVASVALAPAASASTDGEGASIREGAFGSRTGARWMGPWMDEDEIRPLALAEFTAETQDASTLARFFYREATMPAPVPAPEPGQDPLNLVVHVSGRAAFEGRVSFFLRCEGGLCRIARSHEPASVGAAGVGTGATGDPAMRGAGSETTRASGTSLSSATIVARTADGTFGRVDPAEPVRLAQGPGYVAADPRSGVALAAGALLLAVPILILYHRLQKDAALSNETRKRIYEVVAEHPGACIQDVAAVVEVCHSTAAYHLERLHEMGLLVRTPDGNKQRYFKNDGRFSEDERRILPILKNAETVAVLREIIDRDGSFRAEVAHRLAVSPTTVTWHLRRLLTTGLVVERREGRTGHILAERHRIHAAVSGLGTKLSASDPETPVVRSRIGALGAAPPSPPDPPVLEQA
ncbi:MAG: winged helix-turn-helix transcriptional regulator [Methanobacteriota archaeon]